jgi:hypothetical protein
MEVNGQFHAPAALPPEKSPWYPLNRRLVGLRPSMDMVARKEIPTSIGNQTLIIQLTILTELLWLIKVPSA